MTADDDERIRREDLEAEAKGRSWAARSDEFLIGYVSENRPSQFHTPAIVEMQRRQVIATRELTNVQRTFQESIERFNTQTGKQTRRIEVLTWAMALVALLQLAVAALQVFWGR